MTKYRIDALEDLGDQYESMKKWTEIKKFELKDDIDTDHNLKEFTKIILKKAKREKKILKAIVWERENKGRYRIQRLIL